MSNIKHKRPAHRPPWRPTATERQFVVRKRVEGCRVGDIASAVGVHHQTLVKHCGPEIEDGTHELLGKLAAVAYEKALAGDASMLMFVLSRRAGWVERTEVSSLVQPMGQPPVLLVSYTESDGLGGASE